MQNSSVAINENSSQTIIGIIYVQPCTNHMHTTHTHLN